jgi:hypothetical protein
MTIRTPQFGPNVTSFACAQRLGSRQEAKRVAPNCESVLSLQRPLIANAIDINVFIAGRGLARRVETLLSLTGSSADGSYALTDITPQTQPQGD